MRVPYRRHNRFEHAFRALSRDEVRMRTSLALVVIALTVACQRTPEQQQTDRLRADAQQRAAVIENQAGIEADRA